MIRKLTTVLVVVSLVLAAVPSTAAAGPFGDTEAETETPNIIEYAEGPSFVIELSSDSAATELESWANRSGRQLLEVDNETGIAVVAGPRGQIDEDLGFLDRLSTGGPAFGDVLGDRSFVEDVSPNYRLEVDPLTDSELTNVSDYSAPERPGFHPFSDEKMPHDGMAFDSDANRTLMQESRAHLGVDNVTQTGAGEMIAIADTGALTANGRTFGNGTAGSASRILPESKNLITNETVASNGTEAIADGSSSLHGTWTAAAAAGNPSGTIHDGVAPEADLLILKALGDDGSGATADIVQAIRYASLQNASITSLSLGSPAESDAIDRAIEDSYERGTPVVVAAGNSRQSTRWLSSPADSEHAISVAATNGERPAIAQSAYFSNIGPDPGTTDGSNGETAGATVDVAAPGMSTVARIPTSSGAVQNKTLSGTSMATPMVAGGIALGLEANDWTAEEATKRAREAARPVPRAGTTEVGAGMHATDYLVDGTTPETTQSEARTDGAYTRDQTYQGLSDASGGIVTRLFG